MATDIELYNRMNNSALRNRIEVALVKKAQIEIDLGSSPQEAFSFTMLNHQTAQLQAQELLRYLVVKYPNNDTPETSDIDAVVNNVFAKLAGG